MAEPYFIKRHGAWFRPNAHGYTSDLTRAGTWRKEEAERYLDVEGLTIHPASEFTAEIDAELADMEVRIQRLRDLKRALFEK